MSPVACGVFVRLSESQFVEEVLEKRIVKNGPYGKMPLGFDLYPEGHQFLASRSARIFAAVLDYLSVLGLCNVLYFVGTKSGVILAPSQAGSSIGTFMLFFVGIVILPGLAVMIVQVYFMARHAQSIGKRILKIKVVNVATGEKCSFARYFWLRGVVSQALNLFVPFIGLIDPLMIFAMDRRCLHDWIADTIVVIA